MDIVEPLTERPSEVAGRSRLEPFILAFNLCPIYLFTLMRGMRCVLKLKKTSLIDLSLACSIAKLYGFAGNGVVLEVFRTASDPKIR
jgi:hypothetical protein